MDMIGDMKYYDQLPKEWRDWLKGWGGEHCTAYDCLWAVNAGIGLADYERRLRVMIELQRRSVGR